MTSGTLGVVLVPTRELCEQTVAAIQELMTFCHDRVSILGLASSRMADQAAQLMEQPDIVVATPARLLSHLKSSKDTVNFLDLSHHPD